MYHLQVPNEQAEIEHAVNAMLNRAANFRNANGNGNWDEQFQNFKSFLNAQGYGLTEDGMILPFEGLNFEGLNAAGKAMPLAPKVAGVAAAPFTPPKRYDPNSADANKYQINVTNANDPGSAYASTPAPAILFNGNGLANLANFLPGRGTYVASIDAATGDLLITVGTAPNTNTTRISGLTNAGAGGYITWLNEINFRNAYISGFNYQIGNVLQKNQAILLLDRDTYGSEKSNTLNIPTDPYQNQADTFNVNIGQIMTSRHSLLITPYTIGAQFSLYFNVEAQVDTSRAIENKPLLQAARSTRR